MSLANITERHVEHSVTISAPPDSVYTLVADVTQWPRVFPPTIHAEYLERDDAHERLRLWATANGAVRTWTSRRELDPGRRTVTFRQEVSQAPVGSMGGSWLIDEGDDGKTQVTLTHDYAAARDDAASWEWIANAVDRNSRAELGALKDAAERDDDDAFDSPVLSFSDTVQMRANSVDVYDFLYDAVEWPNRLPHVARASVDEEVEGIQVLEMETRAVDGSTHTTRSVRIGFPPGRLVYKQLVLPTLLSVHIGEWTVAEHDGWVDATSTHTVAIRRSAIPTVLGAGADLTDAREFIRHALSTNSTATLTHARSFAESRRSATHR